MLVNRCRNKNSPGQITHFMIGGNVQLYHKDYRHGKRLLSRDYRRSQQKGHWFSSMGNNIMIA
jgi:hypothetical protein